ncbi:MAG: bifunctional phosphopantothenoylcysteine decarboxylase/phosphopantothenate--cysteine ligase CoaBC [Synergistaceae bacterium]|nr:bifunctional phosphopantothenoylcysteine decarboxylase/phosphopantothenate--cysteine ligase CoaBC [Synergistota bacterium]NLM70924.1 bifunctional phosphopantothenoylcysteine decarboxylase/phosphopantothenate--cysteine ligase CoaBC [Synergistaceae bacterium]
MPGWKRNRRAVLGIAGGISAYKAPEIVRALTKAECEVEVVLTEGGERFVSPLTLSTLAGRRAWCGRDFLSDDHGWRIPHISLADWAEIVVVAPCTAETLANTAQGRGKELLGSLILATRAPVLLCPAMNVDMLANAATSTNIETLKERGLFILDPDAGPLACGYEGKGRLPATEVIMEETWRILCPHDDLAGKRVLVTAGPTHEYLDPVRFIGNPSSGKMGLAVARAAWYRGAEVTLVLGPSSLTNLAGLDVVKVVSAEEMREVVMTRSGDADYIVKAAAVGDFRPASFADEKIKRGDRETTTIDLVQNTDIAAALGATKRPGQVLVGFAAESHDIVQNAVGKMGRKKLDYIVANDITDPRSGFGVDTNTVRILGADGASSVFTGSKEDVAEEIWNTITLG